MRNLVFVLIKELLDAGTLEQASIMSVDDSHVFILLSIFIDFTVQFRLLECDNSLGRLLSLRFLIHFR